MSIPFSMLAIMASSVPFPTPLGCHSDKNYAFVEDVSRPVAISIGQFVLLGMLDRGGCLVLESRNLRNSTELPKWRLIAINEPTRPGEKVYEFRSGRLLRGEIMDDGSFVPDLHSRAIDFRDYRYCPDGPRIYNLPGYFVPLPK